MKAPEERRVCCEGRGDRCAVLAAERGRHPGDRAAVWPLPVQDRLPGARRPGGQRGERQRHLSQGLERHAAPPARGAVHLSGQAHQTAVHRPTPRPEPGETAAIGVRPVSVRAGGVRLRGRPHPGDGGFPSAGGGH